MPTVTNNRIRRGGTTVLTPRDLKNRRYPIPMSWKKAIGILKGKNIDPLKYQRQVRGAWEKRLRRQVKLAQHKHDS